MRIIRSIRVDKVIWENALRVLQRNNQYISHFIEQKLNQYVETVEKTCESEETDMEEKRL